jgi:hypothetical protein
MQNLKRIDFLNQIESLNKQYFYNKIIKNNFKWKFKTLISFDSLNKFNNLKILNNWTKKILIFIKFSFQLKNFLKTLFINFLSSEKNLRWFFLRLWLHYRFFFVKFSMIFNYASNFLNYYSLLNWVAKINSNEKTLNLILKHSWFKSIYARLLIIRFQLFNFFKKNMNFSNTIFKNFIFLLKNLLISWNYISLNNKILKSYNQVNYLLTDTVKLKNFLSINSHIEENNLIKLCFKNNLGLYLYNKDHNSNILISKFKQRYNFNINNIKTFKFLLWELNQFFFNYIKNFLKKIFLLEFCFNNSNIKFKTINNQSLNNFIFSFFLEQGFSYNLLQNEKNIIQKKSQNWKNLLNILKINKQNIFQQKINNYKYNSFKNFNKKYINILIEDKIKQNSLSIIQFKENKKEKYNFYIHFIKKNNYFKNSISHNTVLKNLYYNFYIRTKQKKIKQIIFKKYRKNWLDWSLGKYNFLKKNYSFFIYSLYIKKYKNVKNLYKFLKIMKKKFLLKNIKNDIFNLKEYQIVNKNNFKNNYFYSRNYINSSLFFNTKFNVNWNFKKSLNTFKIKILDQFYLKKHFYIDIQKNKIVQNNFFKFQYLKSLGMLNNNNLNFVKKNFLKNHKLLSKILLIKSYNLKNKNKLIYFRKKKKKKLLYTFYFEKNYFKSLNEKIINKFLLKKMPLEIRGWQNNSFILNLKKNKRLRKFWLKFLKNIILENNNQNWDIIIKNLFKKRFKRFFKRHFKYLAEYYYLILQKKFLYSQIKNLNFYFGKKLKNNKFRSINNIFKNIKFNNKNGNNISLKLIKPRKNYLKSIGDRMFLNILQIKYKKNINILNHLKQKIFKTIFFNSSLKKIQKKNFITFKKKYFWISRLLKKKIHWNKQYKRHNFLFKRLSYNQKWKNINKKNILTLGEFLLRTFNTQKTFINITNTENLYKNKYLNQYFINIHLNEYQKIINQQKIFVNNLLNLEKINIVYFKNLLNLQYYTFNSLNKNVENLKIKILNKENYIENILRNQFFYKSLLKINYEKVNYIYKKLLSNNLQETILDKYNTENTLQRHELKRYKKYFWYRQKWNKKSILKRIYNLRSYMLQLGKISKYKKKKFSNIRNKPLLILPQYFEYDFTLLQALMISTPKVGTSIYGGADNNYFYSLVNFYKRRGL